MPFDKQVSDNVDAAVEYLKHSLRFRCVLARASVPLLQWSTRGTVQERRDRRVHSPCELNRLNLNGTQTFPPVAAMASPLSRTQLQRMRIGTFIEELDKIQKFKITPAGARAFTLKNWAQQFRDQYFFHAIDLEHAPSDALLAFRLPAAVVSAAEQFFARLHEHEASFGRAEDAVDDSSDSHADAAADDEVQVSMTTILAALTCFRTHCIAHSVFLPSHYI